MKKMLIVISLLHVMYSLQGMYNKSYWEDATDQFIKIRAIRHIINSGGIDVPLVTMHRRTGSAAKLFLLLVYSEGDPNEQYYKSCNDKTYQSFQQLLLNARHQINQCWPGRYCVISCKYRTKSEDAPRCLAALMDQLKQQNGIIATYAFGQSAHIVNLATRVYEKEFAQKDKSPIVDLMLHVQSPIYEYSWSWWKQEYEYNKECSPILFRKLYNFYTKGALPTYNVLTYPDRKYRQKNMHSIVKNIRMIKSNQDNCLVDMSIEELKGNVLISKLTALLNIAHKYQVNNDLIAQGHDEKNPKVSPIVWVNRFVTVKEDAIKVKYGDKKGQVYTYNTIDNPRALQQKLAYEKGISNNDLNESIVQFKGNIDLERIRSEHK